MDSIVLDVEPKGRELRYIPNVVYEQVPSRGYQSVAMEMDIIQPISEEPMPAIIYLPGGGLLNANRGNGLQQRYYLAEQGGYVVASVTYRCAPVVRFPQPLEDVKSAIRFLKANAAKFNIDPERIGIFGVSAGGYLSALAATTNGMRDFDKGDNLSFDSTIKCAVDFYGLSDLTRVAEDYPEEVQALHRSPSATEALWVNGCSIFGGTDGGILADREAADRANPIHYINHRSVPMLLFHGTADKLVCQSQTEILFKALCEKGIEAYRYIVPNAVHGGIYWVQPKVLRLMLEFFDNHMK